MARPETWFSQTPRIFEEITRAEEGQTYDWCQVAALFAIQRRAASRIIARLQPEAHRTGSYVERSRLLAWLEPIKEQFEKQQKRAAEMTRRLREAEEEKQAPRLAFRERFGVAPPSWTVTPELESAAVTSLPAGIRLAPGKIEITFPPDNPIAGCELLHALSKALEHDWFRFCAAIAPAAVEAEAKKRTGDPIDAFLKDLEQQRSDPRIGFRRSRLSEH